MYIGNAEYDVGATEVAAFHRSWLPVPGWECWRSKETDEDGYGVVWLHRARGGRKVMIPAYRFIHALVFGRVGPGIQLDHLCNNRWCVHPLHLEPVSSTENQRRARLRRMGLFPIIGRTDGETATWVPSRIVPAKGQWFIAAVANPRKAKRRSRDIVLFAGEEREAWAQLGLIARRSRRSLRLHDAECTCVAKVEINRRGLWF